MVKAEWNLALSIGKQVVPLIVSVGLKNSDLPFRLKLLQWIDLRVDYFAGVSQLIDLLVSNGVKTETSDIIVHPPVQLSIGPSYGQLFGIEEVAGKLLEEILDSKGSWIHSIEGLGGIGKSTLVAYTLRQMAALENRNFAAEHWIVVGQNGIDTWDDVNQDSSYIVDENYIYDAIARQLGLEAVPLLPVTEKAKIIRKILKSTPNLIVIDNLQTPGDVKALIPILKQLSNPTTFLLTSRIAVSDDVEPITHHPLKELGMTDTLNLVRYESHQRSIDWVREVPDKELKVIFDTVGGNPLAVKLVVGQLSDLGLDSVLEGLTANLSKEGQKMFRHYMLVHGSCLALLNKQF
ncbi:MAG: hypothetical protein IPK17_04595 [Chloroflexi bacterium]|nr:hypothetical protein [Chloroflexota bacterium]